MIRRIDALLRRQPPPPDDVLQQIAVVLQRARGHVPDARPRWDQAVSGAREQARKADARQRWDQALDGVREQKCDPSDVLSLQIGKRSEGHRSQPYSSLFHQTPVVRHRHEPPPAPTLGTREQKTRDLQVCYTSGKMQCGHKTLCITAV